MTSVLARCPESEGGSSPTGPCSPAFHPAPAIPGALSGQGEGMGGFPKHSAASPGPFWSVVEQASQSTPFREMKGKGPSLSN